MELYNFIMITIEIDHYTVYYYEYKGNEINIYELCKKQALLIDVNC